MGFKQEDVKGVVRTNDGHTAVLSDGRRVSLDGGEAKSLLNRLDKDRARMEREGTREPERDKERRKTADEVHRERQERMRRAMEQSRR